MDTNAMTIAELLNRNGGMELSEITNIDDVIDFLQKLNAESPQQCWSFSGESSALDVGLNGERGALTWWDGATEYKPADGSNAKPVDYWLAGQDHGAFGVGHEISAQRVLGALREFLTTGERPTSVEWVEIDPDTEYAGAGTMELPDWIYNMDTKA